ncbi:MAG: adenylate/guanylate cyclase domain-containing protein [Alphaproteobacteria bacterium]|nr:adenylate/guanylate cyclase domain-containing protein [Alphaproteobacteria bacterium]
MAEASYDVYAFDGQRWTMERNFGSGQEQEAVAHAENLYKGRDIIGVCVVMESLGEAAGKTTDKTIFKKEKRPIPVKGPGGGGKPSSTGAAGGLAVAGEGPSSGGGASPLPLAASAGGSAAAGGSGVHTSRLLTKAAGSAAAGGSGVHTSRLLTKAAGSAAGAGIIAVVAHILLSVMLASRGYSGAATGTAIVVFVLSYISLSWLLMSPAEIQEIIRFAMSLRGSREMDLGPSHVAPVTPAAMPRPRQAAAQDSGPAAPAASSAGEGEPAAFDVEKYRLPLLEDDAKHLVTFLHDALQGLSAQGKHLQDGKLGAFNTFGCHLFLAGASENLGVRLGRSKNEMRWALAHVLAGILNDERGAQNFAENFDEYMMQPKYLEMYKAGADAMDRRQQSQEAIGPHIVEALDCWNDRSEKRNPSDYVCVMFTDIVGSTDFTQTHGDAAQFELIKAHNTIVREALAAAKGREIKHTGDGIMASFGTAYDGVVAAIQIQRAVTAHSGQHPELPLPLRIGLNAGEPIREGSDLFGSTVQLAARVCALAEPGQIIVSYVVQGLCAAKNLSFANLGARALKGFKDPVEVYRVQWE